MSKLAVVATLSLAFLSGESVHAQSEAEAAPERETANDLAKWIDARFEKLRGDAGVDEPELVDDATYLRRVYLDLIGTIPSVARTRDFLADDYPYKRASLVEAILEGETSPYTDRRTLDRSADHMARVWRRILVPSTSQQAAMAVQLEPWLKQQFVDRVTYDDLVKQIIVARQPEAMDQPTPGLVRVAGGPALLSQILGGTPDALADNYTRVFLGVRLGCAKCHDHPFTDWKQADFWGMAAFFSDGNIQSSENGLSYEARFLAGETPPEFGEGATPRDVLADWLTAADNPNFAATAVNRVWQQLLGRPLAGEVDDLDLVSEEERALVLDDLAEKFATNGYDLHWLVEGICKSKVYQRAVLSRDEVPGGPLAGRTLKTMSPEQVFDAMEQALSLPVANNEGSPRHNGQRAAFVQRLDESFVDSPDQFQGGIPQTLMLMHGDIVANATGLESSRTLRAVVEAPFLTTEQKVEALYIAAYTRKPSKKETARLVEYVGRGETDEARRQAYAEIFWALLNSPEFVLSR